MSSVSNCQVSSTDYPGYDPENDHLWDLEEFKKVMVWILGSYFDVLTHAWQRLVVSVTALSEVSIEFDLVGPDASIANAFRRILIAEVGLMNFGVS